MRIAIFNMRRRGSILVGLLWCLVLLAIIVIGVLHMATMDMKVTKNFGDKIQARYLALAGIEKAKALLYQEAHNRMRNVSNRDRDLLDAPDEFKEITFGRGQFTVMHRAPSDDGGDIKFGVGDEESRININTADAEQLKKINGLTADIAGAILAWRGQAQGGASNVNGANADYYSSLQPPYQPRNGPFQTVRELLMVRGVTPELLFGDDTQQNGMLPAAGEDLSGDVASDADMGWASMMTVDSSVGNVNAAGTDRVNIQNADQSDLEGINGMTPAIARAIVQYRNQHPYQSIADLLDVTPNQNGGGRNGGGNNLPANDPTAGNNNNGTQVIDESLLEEIGDDVTVDSSKDEAGLINLNTAGLNTLLCLPGVERETAQAIISYARSQGAFPNVAYLLRVPGVDRQLFGQIAPLVTTRSETYRILSEGKIKSTGVSQRIQVVVRIKRDEVTTLSYREDNL